MYKRTKTRKVTKNKSLPVREQRIASSTQTSLAQLHTHSHTKRHSISSKSSNVLRSVSHSTIKHSSSVNNRRSISSTVKRNIQPDVPTTDQKTPPIRPQFDYKWIKSNAKELDESMKQRNYASVNVDQVVDLIDEHANLKFAVQQQRTYRNNISSQIKSVTTKKPIALSVFDSKGMDVKDLTTLSMKELVEEGKRIKQVSADSEARLVQVEDNLERMAFKLPNLTHPSSPIGDESNAKVLDHINPNKGNLQYYKEKGFIPIDHLDLARSLDWVDFESASSVTGSRFYYLKNRAALLELALVNYALSKLVKRGFTPVLPPDLARLPVIEGAGFQSRDEKSLESQVYRVEGGDLTLCGTSEIPLAGMYMNKIIPEEQLPIKMVAYSHCFRPETGGYGTGSRGLYRVHQFSKVEMFIISTPDQSDELHEQLIQIEKEIFTDLGLNFKVLDMPTGDLGAPAYRKVDMEASMPGRAIIVHNAAHPDSHHSSSLDTITNIPDSFGEISSASNCTDYQSRRLNIRYRPSHLTSILEHDDFSESTGLPADKAGPATRFVHTLNGTAVATPRLIVSIMEQFQNADGTISIPEVLKPYLLDEIH